MEEEVHYRYAVSLRIKNAPQVHEELSKRINPSRVHLKGDLVHLKGERRHENDAWILRSPLDEKDDFTEHMRWIYKEIEPHFEYLMKLGKQGVDMDLFCGFFTNCDCDYGSFTLEPEALDILAKFNLITHFSVYFI